MSAADLRRLLGRATPGFADVRSPDRADFVRRERGHLSLREALDAIDALEFSFDAFRRRMVEVGAAAASVSDGKGVQKVDPKTWAATAEGDAEVGQWTGGYNTAAPVVAGPFWPGARKGEAVEAAEVDVTKETALHALYRAAESLRICPAISSSTGACTVEATEDEAVDLASAQAGWEEAVSSSKSSGADSFKAKDFKGAVEHYSAAIKAAPKGAQDRHTLFSNRSAAFLQLGEKEKAVADARRCVQLAPEWPKGYFREGSALREIGHLADAVIAFEGGQHLEPSNKDWIREVEKTEKPLREQPDVVVRQFALNILPELVRAWVRCSACKDIAGDGVLQLQVNGDIEDFGLPRWVFQKFDRKEPPKAQVRYAFSSRKDFLTNLTANLQDPPAAGVALIDFQGKTLKIADIATFLKSVPAGEPAVQIDVRSRSHGGKMVAVFLTFQCGEDLRRYSPEMKDPAAPKGPVEGVLQAQKKSGFPKAYPRLFGFQNFPGDLNFPVVDTERDLQNGS
eukprot:TRINITY_DN8998_c0_g1_i1.p1 TRINITY_DN8998_c0_g1~~TRINITY_DN8998_c0_g1_i1.p1  ORF type:complete len:511 (-),score=138.38 TRINITY_DN8998_c0_g1_i1:265-1797(-)